jgi:hypothetical protein
MLWKIGALDRIQKMRGNTVGDNWIALWAFTASPIPSANRSTGRSPASLISAGPEEFIAHLVMEMPELVDMSMIYGEERD